MSDEFKTITAGDWTQTFAENRPRENNVAAQIRTAACRHCGELGRYVRTRHFEAAEAAVYECRKVGCVNHGLIWHVDTPNGKAIEPRP